MLITRVLDAPACDALHFFPLETLRICARLCHALLLDGVHLLPRDPVSELVAVRRLHDAIDRAAELQRGR
eukprot:scaffold3388_cov264-Pinguiococcus_pyrenoidosus.AAC.1